MNIDAYITANLQSLKEDLKAEVKAELAKGKSLDSCSNIQTISLTLKLLELLNSQIDTDSDTQIRLATMRTNLGAINFTL